MPAPPKPVKPCKYCGGVTHYPFQCYQNPYLKKYGWKGSHSPKKSEKKRGNRASAKWNATRRKWFIENPAEYYTCYLCGKSLMPYETTLDHVVPRSNSPELRYDMDNLKPCCWECNTLKGSQSLENYKKSIDFT